MLAASSARSHRIAIISPRQLSDGSILESPTPAYTLQPSTPTPLNIDDTLYRGNDTSVSATPSRHNSIPRTRNVSPQR
ncbi:hypothetical protein AUP68_06282 [Ilyonectria robusta]